MRLYKVGGIYSSFMEDFWLDKWSFVEDFWLDKWSFVVILGGHWPGSAGGLPKEVLYH